MCVDAHHAGDKQYVPNSFKLAFIPATAEVPFTSTVADNVVSRKSHYAREGKRSEYAQTTEFYRRGGGLWMIKEGQIRIGILGR